VSLHVVRLGSPRGSEEGLRVGTVRRPPRGVPQSEYGERDYYDLWLPELAPSATLLSWLKTKPLSDARWRTFARRYRAEMSRPTAQRLIALLAALSLHQNLSAGCYCADELRCHRAILRELLRQAGAALEVT
jgi:uncharacterized protein YeaO (DUF488 family)